MNKISKNEGVEGKSKSPDGPLKRRAFLLYSGAGLAASAFEFAGCEDTTTVVPTVNNGKSNNASARTQEDDNTVYLGSGDIGLLNYAYALEQLEAAFYSTVVAEANFSSIFSEEEQTILMDLEKHEIVHREFF